MNKLFKVIALNFFYLFFLFSISNSEIIKDIKISGNNRITEPTVLMFSDINIGDNLEEPDLNKILKNLYGSNFFENISIKFVDGVVLIKLDEAPLIQNISYEGIKANKFTDDIINNSILKSKSSFNQILLSKDVEMIRSQFKSLGYYFVEIETIIEYLENNLVDIKFKVDTGDKSKISKITFLGDKIYKNKKLRSIIVSEEYKFWKIISGKKYLQKQLIELDTRLLKNFYLNKGFYNAKINSSFAKLVNNNEFELIFNIDPGNKIFFNDLNIQLPTDFDKNNYSSLNKLFESLKGNPYSINAVNDILDEVDKITITEEYKSVNASLDETVNDNKLDINFIIEESEKFFVEKINIFGNNITRESVIRNKFNLDEGDPFSEILTKKTENNIKGLNFFKKVKTEITEGKTENSKIINFSVEEKPTGEIMAGAGGGTDGGTVFFGIKENNYLGKGLGVDANANISSTTFKGIFSITNPNYNNTDKSLFANFQATEVDQLKKFGYKTNKNGVEVGTSFEYLEDFRVGISTSTFIEKIETDSTASDRQKKQAGNYLDSFLGLDFYHDKRNQKFKATDGYLSNYNIKLPLISDSNTLTNSINYKRFSELYENNVSSFAILLKNSTSVSNDDIKLSERLFIPSSKLRGFENGKVGPKDGADFIGGNNLVSINIQSTLPILFENSQNLDAIIFFDAANIWGIDYDSGLNDGDKIRSSIGIGFDFLTPVGPLSLSLAEVITKQDTDVEETFRFNLGTTF